MIRSTAVEIMRQEEKQGLVISGREASNRAYAEFLEGTDYKGLLEFFLKERGERFNWKTFHVGMDRAIRSFGEKNLKALGKMVTEGHGVFFKNFMPGEGRIVISFEVDPEQIDLEAGWGLFVKNRVAIEGMENGKITKIGIAEKYDRDVTPRKRAVYEQIERQSSTKAHHDAIMQLLNSLIT